MSRALYQDMMLGDAHVARVREYLREVGFHLPGASPDDFDINRRARYLGYMFQQEDLESFGVGLACTKPGMEGHNTFIRMSRGQLLGEPDAVRLPVNEPVLASESMTLNRLYGRLYGTPAGRAPHGVGTYAGDDGVPGADMDLAMLEEQLNDIIAFHNGGPVPGDQEILDLKIYWGCLLAGRYPRLKHFQRLGQLSAGQQRRLDKLESDINATSGILESLGLPTLDTLGTTPKVDG